MKANFALALLLSLSGTIFNVNAQSIPCEYIPLEFEEIEPLWTHLCIDSTIIGYSDSCDNHNYYDGMQQLRFEYGSIVTDEHLYSVTMNTYDSDDAGNLLEKIDLITGEILWKAVQDLRTSDYRRRISFIEEKNGELHVYGRRALEADGKDDPLLNFAASTSGIHFHWVYDAETGLLLHKQEPDPADSSYFVMDFYHSSRDRFYLEGHQDYFAYTFNLVTEDRQHFLKRWQVDTSGYLISGPDKVVTGFMNDIPNFTGYLARGHKLERTLDDTYLVLEQFSPMDSNLYDYKATLTEYDEAFNALRKVDLTEYLPEKFYQLSLVSDYQNRLSGNTDNYIIIRGAHEPSSRTHEYYTLLLNREFELERYNEISENGEYLDFHWNYLQRDGTNYVTADTLSEIGNSEMYIYINNDEGDLTKVQTFTISEPEWVSFIEKLFVLENGDFLIRMTHSCYENGRKNSWHPEWMRFAKDDILGSVATKEIQPELSLSLAPNPTSQDFILKSNETIGGIFKIIDMSGTTLWNEFRDRDRQHFFEVSGLPSGVYTLMLEDDSNVILRKRFIKIH